MPVGVLSGHQEEYLKASDLNGISRLQSERGDLDIELLAAGARHPIASVHHARGSFERAPGGILESFGSERYIAPPIGKGRSRYRTARRRRAPSDSFRASCPWEF